MKENQSVFWPLALIAAGVLWLLISLGMMPAENLWALTHLWPFLLIALGVGLILRSLWRPLGMIVSTLVVLGAMAAVFYAPRLGWNDAPNWGRFTTDNSFTGAIPGSGVIETKTRGLEDFDSITIRYPGEFIVRQGEKTSVTIEAEKNLIPQLATEIRDGTLYIENSEDSFAQRVEPSENVKITITVTDLKTIHFDSAGTLLVEGLEADAFELKLSGAGDATLEDLEVNSLNVSLGGAGRVTADGTADQLNLGISGFGDFAGAHLQSGIANVLISGAGTATVRVESELTAKVSGAGTINYYGSPKVTQSISGAGSVNQMDE